MEHEDQARHSSTTSAADHTGARIKYRSLRNTSQQGGRQGNMPSVTQNPFNIIATQYAHSILVHKRRLENRQPIIDPQDLP
jgi:hypothetical protein